VSYTWASLFPLLSPGPSSPPTRKRKSHAVLFYTQDLCAGKGFRDGRLVVEDKMVWCPEDCILDRELKSSRYSERRTDAVSRPIQQTLGISGVKAYIAALVDLWRYQRGSNPHPNPPGGWGGEGQRPAEV
jgi:hypothetical protein